MMLLMLDLPEPLLPIRRTFLFLVFLTSGAWPDASPAALSAGFWVSITPGIDESVDEDETEGDWPAYCSCDHLNGCPRGGWTILWRLWLWCLLLLAWCGAVGGLKVLTDV